MPSTKSKSQIRSSFKISHYNQELSSSKQKLELLRSLDNLPRIKDEISLYQEQWKITEIEGIENATVEYLNPITTIEWDAFSIHPTKKDEKGNPIFLPDEPWDESILKRCLKSPRILNLVSTTTIEELHDKKIDEKVLKNTLINGGKIITGYVMTDIINSIGHIISIAIHPIYHHMGFGSKLLESLIDRLRENGLSKVYLEVRKSNSPAIKLYQKYGFNIKGEKKEYFSDLEDAYVMELELEKIMD